MNEAQTILDLFCQCLNDNGRRCRWQASETIRSGQSRRKHRVCMFHHKRFKAGQVLRFIRQAEEVTSQPLRASAPSREAQGIKGFQRKGAKAQRTQR